MKKVFTSFAAAALAGFAIQASQVSYAPQVQMRAPQVSNEIIEEMPDGELSWLERTCYGFVTQAYEATHGIVRGSVVQRVDGEDIYVCGPDRSLPDVWVKARISDSKAIFPSGQYLRADMEIYHYSSMAYWGDPSGVHSIGSVRTPATVKWYDLQGREISGHASGVAVKVTTFTDGATRREKVMLK
ncbi:MAG: hypothetical protein K2J58_07210 [Muribaculaceae bacterium]|nr:hypothetical protein [Muribaculaceae bacterium]